jgi:hypothetical protein
LDWEPAGPKPETEQPAAYLTASPVAGLAREMAVIRIDDPAMVESRNGVNATKNAGSSSSASTRTNSPAKANNSGCSTASHSGRPLAHRRDTMNTIPSSPRGRGHPSVHTTARLINTPNYFAMQFG